jgi:hypothetical protein
MVFFHISQKVGESMQPKYEPYSFGSLPMGALFRDTGHFFVKLHKTRGTEIEFCTCGKSARVKSHWKFAADTIVDAECI